MDFKYVIAWIFVIIGALMTFLVKPIISKKVEDEELIEKYTYIIKTIGMWLVIIGALAIFFLGGNLGAGNQ